MTSVARQLAKLRRGELKASSFQVSGAAVFLKRLHASGAKLHLASGTDVACVVAEVAIDWLGKRISLGRLGPCQIAMWRILRLNHAWTARRTCIIE